MNEIKSNEVEITWFPECTGGNLYRNPLWKMKENETGMNFNDKYDIF